MQKSPTLYPSEMKLYDIIPLVTLTNFRLVGLFTVTCFIIKFLIFYAYSRICGN